MKPTTQRGIWNLFWLAVLAVAGYLADAYAYAHHSITPFWGAVIVGAGISAFLVMVIVGFVVFGEPE